MPFNALSHLYTVQRDGVKLKDKARNLNKTNSWDAPQELRAMPKKVLASYSSIDKGTVPGLRKKNEPWTLEVVFDI